MLVGIIENVIPAFLNETPGKCRFILKRIPEYWKGVNVKIEKIDEAEFLAVWRETVSLGQNEINHANYEMFTCKTNPNIIFFCFLSYEWAKITKIQGDNYS